MRPAPLHQKLPDEGATGLAVLQDKKGIHALADEGRLYGKVPISLTENKAQKGGGASATEPQDASRELPGTPYNELIDIVKTLHRGKKKHGPCGCQNYSNSGAERAAHAGAGEGRLYREMPAAPTKI